jgi:hypothetical protein
VLKEATEITRENRAKKGRTAQRTRTREQGIRVTEEEKNTTTPTQHVRHTHTHTHKRARATPNINDSRITTYLVGKSRKREERERRSREVRRDESVLLRCLLSVLEGEGGTLMELYAYRNEQRKTSAESEKI